MKHIKTQILLAILAIGMFVGSANAQGLKLYPVDEAAQDSSFKTFRDKLLAAARKKDKQYILSILDPNIQLSFGGDAGVNDFKKMWKFDKPASQFWAELITVLGMGGSFNTVDGNKEFLAPYVTSKWPDNPDLDVFEYVAVIGTDVRLRAKPGLKAPIVASLTYDIVKLINTPPSTSAIRKDGLDWIRVKTGEGKEGYVADKFVRSPIDFRASFKQVNGKWRMMAFIAGD